MDLVVRGASLHFVENNQTLAFAQQSFRGCGQRLPHGGHLQVKDPKRSLPSARHLFGKGGFAHLPSAQERHHRCFGMPFNGSCQQIGAGNLLLHIRFFMLDFQQ